MRIGVDIVEIERLVRAIEGTGDTFLRRVYTSEELEAAPRHPARRMEYLAGRWAVKESVAKALGCGIGSKCSLTDIAVFNDVHGAPQVTLSGAGRATAAELGLGPCQISISHERHYAVAVAVFP